LECVNTFFVKVPNIKFHENPFSHSRVFTCHIPTDGQANRHGKANRHIFATFSLNTPKRHRPNTTHTNSKGFLGYCGAICLFQVEKEMTPHWCKFKELGCDISDSPGGQRCTCGIKIHSENLKEDIYSPGTR
jgi:hypothetical protein